MTCSGFHSKEVADIQTLCGLTLTQPASQGHFCGGALSAVVSQIPAPMSFNVIAKAEEYKCLLDLAWFFND